LDYFSRINAGGLDWQRNGTTVREEGYTTELLTNEAVKLILERDQDRPLLLYVTFNAVHAPLQAPQAYVDRYQNIENPRRRTYAAMTTAMDDGIGRILAALDVEKITANTLILFISDNGGGRGAASNVPLRSGKGTIFEGGIRVPAAIWWPGTLEGGEASQQYITAHDWLPTLAAAAGIPVGNKKPLYGQNLWAALRAGKIEQHDDFLIGNRGSYTLFHKNWKLVRTTVPGSDEIETLLFDVNVDPEEKDDLAADHPELVTKLTAAIEAFPKGTSVTGGDPGQRRARRPEGVKPRPGEGRQAEGRPGRRPRPGMGTAALVTEESRPPYAEAAHRD
ncbi:MAG: sulfatase-like hydrolase/transferase, partial [bacterium]|nr:sulfatase-like hydrolase/transferase [bacterium]